MEKDKEQRSALLTEHDLDRIAELIATHATRCNLGLTADEVSTLKRFLTAFDGAASIIGKTILVSLLAILGAIITKGFWMSLAEKLK